MNSSDKLVFELLIKDFATSICLRPNFGDIFESFESFEPSLDFLSSDFFSDLSDFDSACSIFDDSWTSMIFISADGTSFSCGTSISKSSTVISISFIELELVVLSGGVGGFWLSAD